MAFIRALKTIEVIWIEMIKRQNAQRKGGAPGQPMHGLLRERDGFVEGEERRWSSWTGGSDEDNVALV